MFDIEQLRKDIPQGKVLVFGSPKYESSLRRWSAACEKRAAVIVKPTSPNEVAAAIKFAVNHGLSLTVCGGGHSTSGSSSSDGGMVIDLCKMRTVRIDAKAMIVTFGGGCLWSHVDRALEPHGLATVAGVVNHTGVGGLILGGGHGYLTPRHGLTIDNLLSAQVVLADGAVVEASAQQNPDLFWAVRGAGAQFGVVTRFVARAHKQGPVWTGTVVFRPERLAELVVAANEFHDAGAEGSEGHCLSLGIGYAPDGRHLSAIPLYHGSEAEGRRFFKRLLDIEAEKTDLRTMTMAEANTLLNPVFEHGMRRLMGSGNITMPLDAAGLQRTAEKLWLFCEATAKRHGGMGPCVIALELFSTARLRMVPQGATAYANRGDYYDAVTAFGWRDAAADAAVRTFNRELCEEIRRVHGFRPGAGAGRGPVGKYINIEAEKVAPEEAYGGNLERLRELKARFDPGNVFHKWHGVWS